MKKLILPLAVASVAFAPFTLLADEGKKEGEKKTEKTEAKKPDQEIVLQCNDQMQFDKRALEIKAGQTIKLTLKHTGKLDKKVMGHNFVLLAKGTDLAGWAMKAMTAQATEFIPAAPEAKKAILAHTKIIGGGQEDSITFTVAEAGEYEYLCSFPGHFGVMRGKLTVK